MEILIGIFAAAAFMDWRYYKIPNVCIASGMAVGLIMTYVSESWRGLASAIVCMAVIFVSLYPIYLLGGVGAGDVKLFMVAGCSIRGDTLIRYMLVTMAIAAAVSLLKMAVYAESRGRLLYLARYIRKAVITGAFDEYRIDRAQKRCTVRLALPAFASMVILYAQTRL